MSWWWPKWACQKQSTSFIGRAMSLVVGLTITLDCLFLFVCFKLITCFLWICFTKWCRVYLHTLSRVSDSSLFIWHVVWHFQCRGPPVLQHCSETSFYKILHKTWIATPLTCQYLIQKIPLMPFLCRRSGFYLCRIFNEGAWSLWLWHIQLTRHRTHSEQYTKHCYHTTLHTSHVHNNYYMNWSYYCRSTHTSDTY